MFALWHAYDVNASLGMHFQKYKGEFYDSKLIIIFFFYEWPLRKHQNIISSQDPSFPTCNYTHNTSLHYLPDGSIYVEQNVLSLL